MDEVAGKVSERALQSEISPPGVAISSERAQILHASQPLNPAGGETVQR